MPTPLKAFMHNPAAGGILLFIAAVLAIVVDNSPIANLYDALLSTPMVIQIGAFEIDKPLLLWINDGLMAIFFFLVGLEIKRELLEGELSSPSQAALPLVCAIAGLALPALIYTFFNYGDALAMRGWAIPAATDIAFALGLLMLLGKGVPIGVKVFLTAVAIIDDLGAIIIIALFYTENLSVASLAISGVCLGFAFFLNRRGVTSITPYILIGVLMWAGVLKSGVHATLAGVLLAFCIPLKTRTEESPLKKLEHELHGPVAFGILPIFAFANAGFSFAGMSFATLLEPIPLGIAAGLFVGKQVGIFSAAWLMIKLGFARLPDGANWGMMYGTSLLCGVGFTMSLFIGGLAFSGQEEQTLLRVGVLGGSFLSGLVGFFSLKYAIAAQQKKREAAPATAAS